MKGANHKTDEYYTRRIGARVFPAGTIAFAKIGAAIFLERKRLVDQESCLDNNMAGYILQDGRVSRDLVLANLQQFSLGRLVASTALPAIGSGELKSISFPMPSSSAEQQAIAAALSDADGVVAGLERVIAKKRLIKQGAMQDLLSARRRLPGFSGEWEVKKLGDVSKFLSGSYLAKESYRPGGVTVEGAGNAMGEHDEANLPFAISVIGRVGTVGRPRFKPTGCWVNNNAAALRALPGEADPFFVHLLLTQYEWPAATSVTAQPFLVVPTLMGTQQRLPPLQEQQAIAAVLSDMDAEIQTLETRLAKARAVKEGMMQNLLTGRVRLV